MNDSYHRSNPGPSIPRHVLITWLHKEIGYLHINKICI